jgi:hypothetical protein
MRVSYTKILTEPCIRCYKIYSEKEYVMYTYIHIKIKAISKYILVIIPRWVSTWIFKTLLS